MTLTKPLPRIGIDRMYFAELSTEPAAANPTYATPLRLQGAVELAFNPNSQISNYYADDGIYVQSSRPGNLELAVVLSDLLPETYALLIGADYGAVTGQIIESVNDVPLEGALGYRAQLSDGSYEYNWFYVGVFSKPERQYNTKGESISYNSSPIQFMARPAVYAGGKVGVYRNLFFSGDENFPVGLTDALLINGAAWDVDPNYTPSAPGTPIADFAIAAGAGAAGTMAATWTPAVGATLVKIQILDPVSGDYHDATTSAAIAVGAAGATITGLTASNTYTARLVVVSGTNNGYSNTDTDVAHA